MEHRIEVEFMFDSYLKEYYWGTIGIWRKMLCHEALKQFLFLGKPKVGDKATIILSAEDDPNSYEMRVDPNAHNYFVRPWPRIHYEGEWKNVSLFPFFEAAIRRFLEIHDRCFASFEMEK